MQIHEITSRRLNEQGMLGALAKGIGTAVANKFVGATLGIDTRGGGPDDPQARAKAAMEINKSLAGQLGEKLKQIWDNVIENFMATPGRKDVNGARLTNIEKAVPADIAALEKELGEIVIEMSKIDEPTLTQWAATITSTDPALSRNAKDIVDDINFAIRQIMAQTLRPTGQMLATWFKTLGEDISRVQNFNTFVAKQKVQAKSGGMTVNIDPITKKVTIDGNPYDDRNPQHKAAYDAFKAAGGGTP